MSEDRKTLPPRANRGQRPKPSAEEQQRDNLVYNQLFENVNEGFNEAMSIINNKQEELDRVDPLSFFLPNKICHPYARGYHYFFPLNSFPRAEGTYSYAIDENNVFKSTYLQQDKKIGDSTVGSLINRKLFGLPFSGDHANPSKDKNVCHSYLFQNQDKKYQIDKSLIQLKQIEKHLQQLQENGKIKQFSSLRKDIDLIGIVEDNLTLSEKMAIIENKVKILKERKANMKNYFENEDRKFYYLSLNQKIFNEIESKLDLLEWNFIMKKMIEKDVYREGLRDFFSEGLPLSSASYFFQYVDSSGNRSCFSEEMLKKVTNSITPLFYEQDEDFYFKITVPQIFLSFANLKLMEFTEKLLSYRLINQNEALFYTYKIFWKKAFNRDFSMKKSARTFTREEFDKNILLVLSQLPKFKKPASAEVQNTEIVPYPVLDELVNLEVFAEQSMDKKMFPEDDRIEISPREYYCLMLFHHIYMCLAEIFDYLNSNEILLQLMASDYYSKAQYSILEIVGTAQFGTLEQALRNLAGFILRSDFDIEFSIRWIFNPSYNIGYIVKANPFSQQWVTEKQEQSLQESSNHNESRKAVKEH